MKTLFQQQKKKAVGRTAQAARDCQTDLVGAVFLLNLHYKNVKESCRQQTTDISL